MRGAIKLFLLINSLLLITGMWLRDALPPPSALNQRLLEEPLQTPLQQETFQVQSQQILYTIKPLYDYDLVGLVVSKHNADTWWDYLHREWNDHLNITDLCVVWGNNVRSGAYQAIEFSSGQFTCNFSTHSDEAFRAFDQSAISNNHLLTDQTALAKALRAVRVGDQIHIKGRLSEYAHNQGFAFRRGTSTVRTDTGNGACETIFVDQFEMIKSGGGIWRKLVWLNLLCLVVGVVAWFMQPLRFKE